MGNTKLSGKVAIVTGGNGGIGAAICKRLALDGATVVINYRSSHGVEELMSEIQSAGGTVLAVQADVSNREDVNHLFSTVKEKLERVDILVNTVAMTEWRPLGEIDEQHFANLFNSNVLSIAFTTQAAIAHMGESGGRIINFSSGVARSAVPGGSIYAATKAAVEALTRCHAAELGRRKITVNAIAPGLVDTPTMRRSMPPEAIEGMVAQTALGRLGLPEDFAKIVALLASDDSFWITGQVIDANGGLAG